MIGLQDERRVNIRPAKQMWLPFEIKGGLFTSKADTASPVEDEQLMEKVVDRDNLLTALQNVKRNGGSPGIDGMTVKDLPEYLKRRWPKIRRQLLSGTYEPQAVRRVEIPKPGGGIRQLGIPTVLDRFVQQALLQVLQQDCDATFSEFSYGFRPKMIDQQNGILSLQLRGERSGSGDGRVYTITITATDESNNDSQAEVKIIVPHDNSKK